MAGLSVRRHGGIHLLVLTDAQTAGCLHLDKTPSPASGVWHRLDFRSLGVRSLVHCLARRVACLSRLARSQRIPHPLGHSSWRTTIMAKALFGHVGSGSDVRLSYEVRRLRARVAELEDELARTRALNDALEGVDVSDELRVFEAEPALT
nr:hypothetical protein [Protofrankia symbiont of Coriaria ruscifolia]